MSENCLSESHNPADITTSRNLTVSEYNEEPRKLNLFTSGSLSNNGIRMQQFSRLSINSKKENGTFLRSLSQSKKLKTQEITSHTVILMYGSFCKLPDVVLERSSSLRILDLSHNQLEYFPVEITQIKHLKTLRLNYNKIKSVPSEISKLTNLSNFSIVHNNLKGLPSSLASLPVLKELNIESNFLETFGQEVTGIKTLECLNIYQNRLSSLPTKFKDLENLKDFRFEWLRYVDSTASCYLRGEDGVQGIKQLQNYCAEMEENGVEKISFFHFCKAFIENQGEQANLTGTDKNGGTILHLACLYEDISVIKYVISEIPEFVDQTNNQDMTPLGLSIFKDKYKSSEYLLRHGANPTKGDGIEGSPIFLATKRLNCDVVKGILRLGENPNRVDFEGNTPLHYAMMLIGDGYVKATRIIQHLIDHGANINAKNYEGWTPLHLAARKRENRAIEWASCYNREVMEIHGRSDVFDFNVGGGPHNWTIMHIAAYSDNIGLLKLLGEIDTDIFEKSLNGHTAKRLVSKLGIGLKLLEKSEKERIKAKVFRSKQQPKEPFDTSFSLSQVVNRRTVQNASKNLFQITTDLETEFNEKLDFSMTETCTHTRSISNNFQPRCSTINPATPFGVLLATRLSALESKIETKQMMRNNKHKISFQVLPETEVNTENNSLDEIEETHPDFCLGDVNENVKAQPDIYVRNTKAFSLNERRNKSSESLPSNVALDCTVNIQDIRSIIEYVRGLDLRRINFSSLGYFKEQLRPLELVLTHEEFSLCDKIKLLTELKTLYKKIQSLTTNGNELKEITGKEDDLLSLIPKSLINTFQSLRGSSTEGTTLKLQICRAFGEIKDANTRDFLYLVGNDPQENLKIKDEAKGAVKVLEIEMELQRLERTKDLTRTEDLSKENCREEGSHRESMGWMGKRVALFSSSATKLKKENLNEF